MVTLEEGMSSSEAVAAFSLDPAVEWAEPNWIYRVAAEPLPPVAYVPDDRYVTQDGVTWSQGVFPQGFPDLYGLRNTRSIEGWRAHSATGPCSAAESPDAPGMPSNGSSGGTREPDASAPQAA